MFLTTSKNNVVYCTRHRPLFKEEVRQVREEDEIPITYTTVPVGLPPCDENVLVEYLAEIQVINPESIIGIALADIKDVCRKVQEGIDRINQYLTTCNPPNQKDLYIALIAGVKKLHIKVCEPSRFRDKFNKYYPCYHELLSDYDGCSGPADWNENSDDEQLCKAYKDICDCYYIKTAKVCGEEAAATIKELLIAVVGSVTTVPCSYVNWNPAVDDALPKEYARKLYPGNKATHHPDYGTGGIITPLNTVFLIILLYMILLYLFLC